jgi:membrane protease YdiL (CAAX protease family)
VSDAQPRGGASGLVRAFPILSYVAVAYLWSWSLWLFTRAAFGPAPAPDHSALWFTFLILGAIGPTMSAIACTALQGGKPAVGQLLRRYLIWRVPIGWYLAAILIPWAYFLSGAGIYTLRGGTLGPLHNPGVLALLIAVVAALPAGPICEELGWRGYLLPALQRNRGALASSLIVGFFWWLWHAPLMWMAGGTLISGVPVTLGSLALYLAWVAGVAVLFTWIANHTRGSVLLAVLVHAGLNSGIVPLFFPEASASALRAANYWSVIAVWVGVVTLVLIYGPARLSRKVKEAVPSGR